MDIQIKIKRLNEVGTPWEKLLTHNVHLPDDADLHQSARYYGEETDEVSVRLNRPLVYELRWNLTGSLQCHYIPFAKRDWNICPTCGHSAHNGKVCEVVVNPDGDICCCDYTEPSAAMPSHDEEDPNVS